MLGLTQVNPSAESSPFRDSEAGWTNGVDSHARQPLSAVRADDGRGVHHVVGDLAGKHALASLAICLRMV